MVLSQELYGIQNQKLKILKIQIKVLRIYRFEGQLQQADELINQIKDTFSEMREDELTEKWMLFRAQLHMEEGHILGMKMQHSQALLSYKTFMESFECLTHLQNKKIVLKFEVMLGISYCLRFTGNFVSSLNEALLTEKAMSNHGEILRVKDKVHLRRMLI